MKYLRMVLMCFLLTPAAYAENGWVLQTPPTGTSSSLGKVQFVTPSMGCISVGDGRIARTLNAGAEWDVVTLSPGDTVGVFCDPDIAMSFASGTNGWITGTLGGFENPSGAVMYKTTNSGATWSKKILSPWKFGFSVNFVDANHGWASVCSGSFTDDGEMIFTDTALLKTTDGGDTWTKASDRIGIAAFVDANTGWMVSDSISASGQSIAPHGIYRTTDGGTTWDLQLRDDTLRDARIYFTDANNGWVAGRQAIYHTTNGGVNWTSVTNTGLPLSGDTNNNVFFINANIGWISSNYDPNSGTEYSAVAHTSNGGASWSLQDVPLNEKIFSINFADTSNGWIVFDSGQIARTTTGGGPVSVESEIPIPFTLNQNYPNPFNPRTTISFTLPTHSAITLKVFDVTGREVATLASGAFPAGEHAIQWNAESVASGVYFCRLQAGGMTESRKLVLVK